MALSFVQRALLALAASLWVVPSGAASLDGSLEQSAKKALDAAGTYFSHRLGVEGTYVWQYSASGAVRRGERGTVSPTVGWVQPPGTPAVGAAYLRIFELNSDRQWLEAAADVAKALTESQLLSGGWFYLIETNPAKRGSWCYRVQTQKGDCRLIKDNPDRNETVMDDNNSQSALNFLMWYDRASNHQDPGVADAVRYGLKRIMRVQYPNGAIPVFFENIRSGDDVVAETKASLPATWQQQWEKPRTPPYFIVNDNLPRDTGRLFLNAYHLYGKDRYRAAAIKTGNFLLGAQLPAPQTGWAQQYDRTLQPVWGRIFEPPALVSWETAGSIDFLVDLFLETGERKYLDAANAAAVWLKVSRLPDGTWTRYYELNTNRPLYVTNDNKVTFEPVDLIDHYGMRGTFDIPDVLERLERATSGAAVPPTPLWVSPADRLSEDELEARVQSLVASQDAHGRWMTDGWIDGRTFVDGVFALSRFLTEVTEPAR